MTFESHFSCMEAVLGHNLLPLQNAWSLLLRHLEKSSLHEHLTLITLCVLEAKDFSVVEDPLDRPPSFVSSLSQFSLSDFTWPRNF